MRGVKKIFYGYVHKFTWYFISTIKALLFVDFLSILPQPFKPIFSLLVICWCFLFYSVYSIHCLLFCGGFSLEDVRKFEDELGWMSLGVVNGAF